jgi:hypothetical protein
MIDMMIRAREREAGYLVAELQPRFIVKSRVEMHLSSSYQSC